MGAGRQVFGQQRRLWITFVEVLDDRRRLDQQIAVVGAHGGARGLGVTPQDRVVDVLVLAVALF